MVRQCILDYIIQGHSECSLSTYVQTRLPVWETGTHDLDLGNLAHVSGPTLCIIGRNTCVNILEKTLTHRKHWQVLAAINTIIVLLAISNIRIVQEIKFRNFLGYLLIAAVE